MGQILNRDEGHALLNKMREGQTFEYEQITAALVATGDLAGWRDMDGSMAAGMRSQGMDHAVQTERQGTGPEVCGDLVGQHEGSHTQGAWPGWSKYLDR